MLRVCNCETSIAIKGRPGVTHAVGMRAYKIIVTKKGSSSFIDPDDTSMPEPLPAFLDRFILDHEKFVNKADLEKGWKITEFKKDKKGDSRGLIAYGRYGFAASIQDVKTGKETHRRKRTESEVIDLYYRLWRPDREKFYLASFSSFSGRSCITIIFNEMKSLFETKNPGFLIKFLKLMPSGASAKIYSGKPVKNLRLISRKPRNDLAEMLFKGKSQKTNKMTVTIHSTRNGRLGDFNDLLDSMPADSSGVITYDGIEFDQAIAMIKIGDELRPVGIFGAHADVGVVDVTEDVVKDDDGIPTYESLDLASTKILKAMYDTLHGLRS